MRSVNCGDRHLFSVSITFLSSVYTGPKTRPGLRARRSHWESVTVPSSIINGPLDVAVKDTVIPVFLEVNSRGVTGVTGCGEPSMDFGKLKSEGKGNFFT